MAGAMAAVLVGAVLLGLLGWRAWSDRQKARADRIRAAIRASIDRTLGGESLVSVEIQPAVSWRPGRVVLSTPTDWEWLLREISLPVLDVTPPGYEVIVRRATLSPYRWRSHDRTWAGREAV